MPLTIRDAESSFLHGKSVVEEWKRDFLAQWFQPDQDLILVTFWTQLDPGVKAQLKALNPAAYSQVEQQVKQIKERYQNGTNE